MKPKSLFLFVIALCIKSLSCQTISGTVIDATTKEPIEAVAVYFDSTTKGTTTNSNGEFSISYNNAIQSPLVITFLGYKKQIITDYRSKTFLDIQLEEQQETLDEVLINTNDGLTRKEKLKVFRREFLGTSRFGLSCKILNEDAIIIKYIKKKKQLIAYSYEPLQIENKALQYIVSYDLSSFSAQFLHSNPKRNNFEIYSAGFQGNPYYQDMPIFKAKKAKKNRAKVYKGSTLQFMRALFQENLKDKGFFMFIKGRKMKIEDVFDIKFYEDTNIKKVSVKKKRFVISYRNKQLSKTQIKTPYFLIDAYGNYSNVTEILFSGHIGKKRFGDLLPFDYGINNLL